MDISVIVAIYGAEKYIEECLRSLFSQTKTIGVEFILVNDCTPDHSMDIAQRLIEAYSQLNVKVINHDVNCGVAMSRQSGIDSAIGKYMIHIDPDDWCEPNMLEDLFRKAELTRADVVVCDYYVNYVNKELYIKQKSPQNGHDCISLVLGGQLHGSLSNKLINMDLCFSNNIRFIPNINMWEDQLVCMKNFSFAKNVVYLPNAYLHYRQRKKKANGIISDEKLKSLTAAPSELETFFKENELFEKFEGDIMKMKIGVKLIVLQILIGDKRQKDYITLFPDANAHIGYANISRKYKFAYNQAINGRLYVFNLIYRLNKIRNVLAKYIRGRKYVVKY